jgi:peptidoglycan hydrolase-like amidase
VCNDDCCQRFQGVNNLNNNSLEIASKSRGKVLTYASSICDARYSKSCGGIMESFENLWEDKKLPYMQNLIDAKSMQMPNLKKEEHMLEWVNEKPKTFCSPHFIPEHNLSEYLGKVDEEAEYFRWKVKVSQKELVENINSKLNHEIKAVNALKVLKRGGSGRMLELRIDYLDKNDKQDSIIVYKDYDARDLLHPSFLYSSACIISPIHSDNSSYPDFEYQGAGWGHGAGMCQIGALGMALAGYKANEILEHYYPGSKMDVIYP